MYRACVLLLSILCLQLRGEETGKVPPPPVPPLANAVLSPALRVAADHDHIDLSSREIQAAVPMPGDAIVFWIGATQDGKSQQWLVQLKRGTATAEEQKAHHGKEVKKYLSWGSVVVFHSEVEAIDLWIAGPVTMNAQKETTETLPVTRIRRTRVFVPRDYLRLGLDDSVRATSYINQRMREILKEDPKFGVGHIYSLDEPIKPENVVWAKPVAARIGFTPAMEQAWTGGYVALEAFFQLVNDVPELKEIGDIAINRPAPWKYLKLAFGSHFKTFFGDSISRPIDPVKMGFLPVALESFEVPFSFTLENDLIVSGAIAVTSPIPPLDVSAGILAIVAIHPKDKTRMVHLIAISSSRGDEPKPKKP